MISQINQIMNWLEEINDEENGCNEGSLDMYYKEIIDALDNIKFMLTSISLDIGDLE